MSHPAIYIKIISAVSKNDMADMFYDDRKSQESNHRLNSTRCRHGNHFSRNLSSCGGKRGNLQESSLHFTSVNFSCCQTSFLAIFLELFFFFLLSN